MWLPQWSIQRLVLARPELKAGVVLLTVEKPGRGEFIDACDSLADRRGVRRGMPVAEARALLSPQDSPWIDTRHRDLDRQALEKVALLCERYSPCVGIEEADPADCLLLDVTGLSPLWVGSYEGEEGIARQIDSELTARGFQVRVAIGDTVGAAWGASHFLSEAGRPVVLPMYDRQKLCPLPLEGLRISEAQIRIFHRLGVRTIGEVLKLQRSTLPARFDASVLQRIAQLTGEQAELFSACRPTPRFIARRALEYGITRTNAIEQLWWPLLNRVVGQLQARQLGTRRIQCRFHSEIKTRYEIDLRMCEAVCDAKQIGELLRLKMEAVCLNGPLIDFQLEALETTPLVWQQQTFFSGQSPRLAQQWTALLNRLSSRLGDETVTRPYLHANPVPERAISLIPAIEKAKKKHSQYMRFLPLDRPTYLFPRPQPINAVDATPEGAPEVLYFRSSRLEIARWWGPERIEACWWQGRSVQREYYWVESTAGERFWLFRQLRDQRWFVHGELM